MHLLFVDSCIVGACIGGDGFCRAVGVGHFLKNFSMFTPIWAIGIVIALRFFSFIEKDRRNEKSKQN